MNINEICKEIPKVELHFHLTGAIPIPAFWKLVQKYDNYETIQSIDDLEKKFQYRDFIHFLQVWRWKNQFIREYDDFEFVAKEVSLDLQKQNITYVEAFVSASDFINNFQLELPEIYYSIRKGLNSVSGTKVNIIGDLVRNYGPEEGNKQLEEIKELKHLGVLGIGIGGSEREYPPEIFRKVYEKARKYGLKTTAHAGEVVGPENIWSAIKSLKVDRIGHATSIIQDVELIKFVKDHEIPLELCPGSNVKTGSIRNIGDHPIKTLFDQGLLISVNTDDPHMFQTTMEEEFMTLYSQFGFNIQEIYDISKRAIASSWTQDAEKEVLLSKLNNFAQNISENLNQSSKI